jgi:hypothetical protein
MSGLEEGSGADDDWYVESDGEAISLWMIFGISIVVALGITILYQCRRSPPEDLTEGLVAVRMARDNDAIDDDDDEVFGRLDSKV